MEEKRKVLRQLFEAVCEILGCDSDKAGRPREMADARFVYYRIAKETYPDITDSVIGEVVGRDRTSVIHGLKCANGVTDVVQKYNKFVSEYSEPMPEERLIEMQ